MNTKHFTTITVFNEFMGRPNRVGITGHRRGKGQIRVYRGVSKHSLKRLEQLVNTHGLGHEGIYPPPEYQDVVPKPNVGGWVGIIPHTDEGRETMEMTRTFLENIGATKIGEFYYVSLSQHGG